MLRDGSVTSLDFEGWVMSLGISEYFCHLQHSDIQIGSDNVNTKNVSLEIQKNLNERK